MIRQLNIQVSELSKEVLVSWMTNRGEGPKEDVRFPFVCYFPVTELIFTHLNDIPLFV